MVETGTLGKPVRRDLKASKDMLDLKVMLALMVRMGKMA